MKKSIIRTASFSALVSAAMAFTACTQIDDPQGPSTPDQKEITEEGTFTVNFECSLPDEDEATRTEFHDNTIWWSVGDQALFAQYAVVGGSSTLKTTRNTALTSSRAVLSLTVSSFNEPDAGTDAAYFSIYPYASYAATTTSGNVIYPRITLPSTQSPSANSFDPNADLLISQYVTNLEANEDGKYSVKLKYKRMVAIAKMTIKNLPSSNNISSIVFSAKKSGNDVEIAGSRLYDLVNGKPSTLTSSSCTKEHAITLDYSDQNITADGSTGMTAYFMCYPFELEAGDSFKVVVTTTAGEIFTKEVSIPSGRTLGFNEGKGSIFSVDMATATEMLARYSNDGGNTWAYTATLKEAIAGATGTEAQPAKVELLKDASHNGAASINLSNKYIEINGNGHTYDVSNRVEGTGATTTNTVFYVGSSSTEGNAKFFNITFDGKNSEKKSRLLFNNSANSTVSFDNSSIVNIDLISAASSTGSVTYGIIYNVGKICLVGVNVSDCSSKPASALPLYGGFIYNNDGTVEMTSGTVSGCSAIKEGTSSAYGGFVYSTGTNGSFTISGGTVSGCNASNSGGAIYVSNGSAKMSANSVITNCSATNGGAIFIYNGSVEMTGGSITECEATYGGAIDCRNSFTMTGGNISNCSSTSFGGALYLTGDADNTIKIAGGTIENCTGTYGTVCVNMGILTVESGSITASGSNYAIGKSSNTNSATININGGLIESDEAYAVYAGTKGGTVNITDGTIKSDNYRGVYLKACKLVMEGGLIDANTYGIYNVYDKADATILQIDGGEIKSSTNYSIYLNRNTDAAAGTLNITGGRFTSPSSNLYNTNACQVGTDTLSITGGSFNFVSTNMSTFLKDISNDSYKFGAKDADGYRQVVPNN